MLCDGQAYGAVAVLSLNEQPVSKVRAICV